MPIRIPQRPLSEPVKEVLSLIRRNGFIAGSCARYYASTAKDEAIYNDIDVFARSIKGFNEICWKLEHNGWTLTGESPNAMKFAKNFDGTGAEVEVVKPFQNEYMCTYGDPKNVIMQFDFTCVKAFFYNRKYLYIDEQFDTDNNARRLVITHINCPVAVAQRVMRYAKKGYTIGIRELLKLFTEWSQRPDAYREHLTELLHRGELTDDEFMELERLLRVD